MTVASAAGVVGVAGTASAVGALIVLHVLPTGLSPVRDAVSHYGITRYRAGYRVLTMSMGVAGLALAVGLRDRLGSAGTLSAVCLVVFGLARLAISWFPMDEPGTPMSVHGRRHGLLAFVTFGGVTIAAARLRRATEVAGQWAGVRTLLVVLAWLLLAVMLAMFAASRDHQRRCFGLIERAFYLVTFAWLLVVAIKLI